MGLLLLLSNTVRITMFNLERQGSSWVPVAVVGVLGYLTLCRVLRFRNIQALRSQLNYPDRASLSRMTVHDAQKIINFLYYKEFPLFYDLSLRFALFKTYSVTNVARVLATNSDLSRLDVAGKRYEDTSILYTCFARFQPGTEAFLKAVARMNYLHAPYIKAGKILNKDLLYVLFASMGEPVQFLRMFEWRPLTDMEIAGLGTLWKHVGDLMGIDFKAELGKDQWTDGIDFMDDVRVWARAYEDEFMQPNDHVQQVGNVTMDLLLVSHPKFARSLAYEGILVVMGDRLRHAFRFPEPSLGITCLTFTLLLLRAFTLRHLCLPRFFTSEALSDPDPKTGRIHHYRYMREPWYNPPTFWTRWNPEALITWVTGGLIPSKSAEWKPEGFLYEDIGPRSKMGKGIDELSKTAADLAAKSHVSTRPFLGPAMS
ncbi:unnamed protein product [Clonostachys rosea]|uniref:ER-bound oxygenase mpaB/mpaB'/Rubber oxygenase catalytic domain-containing protein n=1 Tax=Bionectria ochroleuca TaxID=29856 RepID=A0ABY6URT3_BIOOC|nr:unnamed protein product [Clonostachys rosea]